MNMKLLANLSLRAFPTIKNLTEIFSINALLLKLVRFMTCCLFLDSSGLLNFSFSRSSYYVSAVHVSHVAGFWETVQMGFPLTSTHA